MSSLHVTYVYACRSPLLDKEFQQPHLQHYRQCISNSPYHQIYSSDIKMAAVDVNSRHACALSDEELEAATLQTDTTSTQATETSATRQSDEYQLNSQVTCSAADPDVTRVQTAQA